jgi:hypothetical protein
MCVFERSLSGLHRVREGRSREEWCDSRKPLRGESPTVLTTIHSTHTQISHELARDASRNVNTVRASTDASTRQRCLKHGLRKKKHGRAGPADALGRAAAARAADRPRTAAAARQRYVKKPWCCPSPSHCSRPCRNPPPKPRATFRGHIEVTVRERE